ncbi:MAG: hypothetical protein FWE47_02655 [Oscillospiraceae bacterium]|nr:hypothetical protein [Oscillospiraceae bacterium]
MKTLFNKIYGIGESKIYNNFFRLPVIFITIFALLAALLIGLYTLPIDKAVQKNVSKANASGYTARTDLDPFTNNVFILGISKSATSKHPIFSALNAPNHPPQFNPEMSMSEFIRQQDMSLSYGNYWHGWALYLRPLLTVFNYSQIVVINAIILSALVLLICYLLFRRKNYISIVFLLLTLWALDFRTLYLSQTFFTPTLIALLACLLVIWKFGFKEKPLIYATGVFLIIGMLTSYVDMLTYPLVTFVLPVGMLLLTGNKVTDWQKNLILAFKAGIAWLAGYLALWFGKFLVFGYMISPGRLNESLGKLGKYTDGSGFDILKNVFKVGYGNSSNLMLWLFIGIAIALIIFAIIKRKEFPALLPAAALIILPIAYIYFTKGHSVIHARFTFKTIMLPIFTIGCCIDIMVMKFLVNQNSEKS